MSRLGAGGYGSVLGFVRVMYGSGLGSLCSVRGMARIPFIIIFAIFINYCMRCAITRVQCIMQSL